MVDHILTITIKQPRTRMKRIKVEKRPWTVENLLPHEKEGEMSEKLMYSVTPESLAEDLNTWETSELITLQDRVLGEAEQSIEQSQQIDAIVRSRPEVQGE